MGSNTTACDGGDNAKDAAGFDFGILIIQIADVIISDEDVNEGPELAVVIYQMLFEIREIECQVLDRFFDVCAVYIEPCFLIGKLPKWSRDNDGSHGIVVLFIDLKIRVEILFPLRTESRHSAARTEGCDILRHILRQ
jgi:hypothetical protein